MTITCLELAAKHIEKDERKRYIKQMTEESKIVINRQDVTDLENRVLQLLEWKIPNYSVRHFLEGLLCVGFANTKDKVYSFLTEARKEDVANLFETH